MNKTLAKCAAALTTAAMPALARAAAPTTAPSDKVVVMISVDGLAGFYFDDPKAEMPNIRALAAAGARASGMEAVVPTVTWPNHTTLVTGDYPGRHGVVGNNYLDRDTNKRIALIGDKLFDKDQIVKVPTIYDVAKQAGMTTAAIKWPASRGAKTLDWTVPDCGTDGLILKYSTPALIQECVAAGITSAPTQAELSAAPDEKDDGPRRFDDQAATDAFNLILKNHRPGLALLHVAMTDHQEHLFGPRTPEAYEAVKQADRQVGQVWDEVKRDYPGRATVVIVSDHGFSPIDRTVLPNVILRDAGLIKVKGVRAVGGDVRCVVQGGSVFIYFDKKADRAELTRKVAKAFTGVTGIEKVIAGDDLRAYGVADASVDPHAPDMVAFADEGYAFGDTAGGALTFNEKPERKGTHGHDPRLPHLQATFVAWGTGIRPGVSLGLVRNTDVAPTLAAVLGVKLPDTDGKPLAAALDANLSTASAK